MYETDWALLPGGFESALGQQRPRQLVGTGEWLETPSARHCRKVTRGKMRLTSQAIGCAVLRVFQGQRFQVCGKQRLGLGGDQVTEMYLQIEAPQGSLVQVSDQVGRGNEQPLIALHLREHFIDRGHLPALPRLASVLQKTVNLIEQQHCVFLLRALEGARQILLRHSDIG